MQIDTFNWLWLILQPKAEYNNRERACRREWEKLTLDKQREVYRRIRDKRRAGEFVNENPLFALMDNLNPPAPRQEVMTYGEYYATYRTTEPTDGWQMRKDAAGKVIYVKD